jgi:FkbM family methyltransferase
MISYSSNHEDVLLARVFAGQPSGFYIDVGANDPIFASLTHHLYQVLGWHGINIEPVQRFYDRLVECRPRDLNLQVALSKKKGQLTIYEHQDALSGLSTLDREVAESHRQDGRQLLTRTVPTRTLREVCAEHAPQTVDLLSIDVEGHELEVLQGADFRRCRPRVVMVEATKPNSRTPSHEAWEPLLLAADYTFALFDGVNRYYARSDEPELRDRLAQPVCVFDQFTTVDQQSRLRHFEETAQYAQSLAWRAEQLERELAAAQKARVDLANLRDSYRCVGPGTLALANRFDAVKKQAPALLHRLRRTLRQLG